MRRLKKPPLKKLAWLLLVPLTMVAAYIGTRFLKNHDGKSEKLLKIKTEYAREYMKLHYGHVYNTKLINNTIDETPLPALGDSLRSVLDNKFIGLAHLTEMNIYKRRMIFDDSLKRENLHDSWEILRQQYGNVLGVIEDKNPDKPKEPTYENNLASALPENVRIPFFWPEMQMLPHGFFGAERKGNAYQRSHLHQGMDFINGAEPEGERQIGQEIRAPMDCIITDWRITSLAGGATGMVVLEDIHGYGLKFRCMHIDLPDEAPFGFEKGSIVKAGEPFTRIHEVRPNEASSIPHFHFECWLHNEPIDPARIFKGMVLTASMPESYDHPATSIYGPTVAEVISQDSTGEKFEKKLAELRDLDEQDLTAHYERYHNFVSNHHSKFKFSTATIDSSEFVSGPGHDSYADTKNDPIRDAIINTELDIEGSEVTKEHDGGISKYGITSATFGAYLAGRGLSVSELTRIDAYNIIGRFIYDKVVRREMTPKQKLAITDASMNMGGLGEIYYREADGDVKKMNELRAEKYHSLATGPKAAIFGQYETEWTARLDKIAEIEDEMDIMIKYSGDYLAANLHRDEVNHISKAKIKLPPLPLVLPQQQPADQNVYAETQNGRMFEFYNKLDQKLEQIRFALYQKQDSIEKVKLQNFITNWKQQDAAINAEPHKMPHRKLVVK